MYTVKNSERNNEKATEFETKSLLYMLTKSKDKSDIELFIIDCFNDVTAVSENYTDSWDIQSKGVASLSPARIGKALYTLFDNYVSEIHFGHRILYMPIPNDEYVLDSNAQAFDISNFVEQKKARIRAGLFKEINDRADPEVNTENNKGRIDQFLSDVLFVVDRCEKAEYIRAIIQFKNLDRLTDEFLNRIFEEIQAQQATKKIKNVCGAKVSSIRQMETPEKSMYRKDIELLVVNRVIGNDLFSKHGIPVYFMGELQGIEEDDIPDIIQECQAQISRTLFNKNNKKAFWRLLEDIVSEVTKSKRSNIRTISSRISIVNRLGVHTLDDRSLLYLISLVKEGLR